MLEGRFALMGSGETSPTMVGVHRKLTGALPLDGGAVSAVLLQTPYDFQENAADISARAQKYFADACDLRVDVVTDADDAGGLTVRSADWVFSGPGSPTYALTRWRDRPIGRALRERVRSRTGLTVLASAAAATAGVVGLPVYEIYKVGESPAWAPGLDLLAELGLRVAVIPHYDNAEGGTHDTRYCYLGERRLSLLERELPDGAAVLGVDEHTAVIVDLVARTVEVSGRGGLTVRRPGHSVVVAAGSRIDLGALVELTQGATAVELPVPPVAETAVASSRSLVEITRACERFFDAARQSGDGVGMARAVLDLEAAIQEWATDTEEDEGTGQARDVLRGLVVRLGEVASEGLRDPEERVRSLVDPLLSLRASLRERQAYEPADAIRAVLTGAGIEVRDAAEGTTWSCVVPSPE